MPIDTSASERRRPRTGKALVDALAGSDSLPGLIEQMNPSTLERLVSDVGIEDAGALVVHASAGQLTHLLDETIWTGASPGDPETLSVENLLRWLAVWHDADVANDKLYELGEDFCALAFSRLVVVADTDMSPRVGDEFTQVLGEYILRSRQDDEWDVTQACLNDLWGDYPDFLEAVLGRLAFRHSVLGISGEDDTARVLDADASHERERKREARGFVTSVMAGAWLRDLNAVDLDAIAEETAYDLDTSEYFRRREQEAAAGAELRDERESARQAARRRAREDDEDFDTEEAELDELQAELEAFEAEQSGGRGLLTAPGSARKHLPLRIALAAVGERAPDTLARRGDELAYLANLLLTGVSRDEERLSEAAAAELALATANLGGSYLVWLEFGDEADSTNFAPWLDAAPGVVRLFRIGWHLLSRVPLQVAGRLERLRDEAAVRDWLASRPMVSEEVDALLTRGELLTQVRAARYEEARETLRLLAILFEPRTVSTLCALTDGAPALPRRLEHEEDEDLWGGDATATRNLEAMGDLMLVDQFLRGLPQALRG